jgi:hypothetical protein
MNFDSYAPVAFDIQRKLIEEYHKDYVDAIA